jgi:hypothetical protein
LDYAEGRNWHRPTPAQVAPNAAQALLHTARMPAVLLEAGSIHKSARGA